MKILKTITLMLFIFCCGIGFNMYRFGYNFHDGFWRTLMSPFEGTVWAPNFTEEKFNQVKLGMSYDEVQQLLGKSVVISGDCSKGECFWFYTWHDTPTADFDQRWIIFNNLGRVSEIRKSFYID